MTRARHHLVALISLTVAIGICVPPVAGSVATPPKASVEVQTTTSAVGYGSHTRGGAGGRLVWVRSLADTGPGSLRAALESRGRRTVRFRVAGTIVLHSPIKIRSPYVTVAGNGAPGEGVQVRGAPIVVVTHDVILRYLRLRPGDAGMTAGEAAEADALTLNGVRTPVYNILVDHLSLLWGPDIGGLAILGNVHHVTVQNSIIGEGLLHSRHPEGQTGTDGHSMAINATPMKLGSRSPARLSFYRNLLTTSDVRMPRFIGAACVDFVNNLVYNWGSHAGSGNVRSMNMIGNWFRRGPRIHTYRYWWPKVSNQAPRKFAHSVFTRDNKVDGFRGGRARDSIVYAGSVRCYRVSVHPSPASGVYYAVLTNVGARLPVVDSVDRRVINNVKNRAGSFYNGVDFRTPHPYWPQLLAQL
jgi:hypothetical protein